MPRAKGGTKTRARHKKRLKLAKGYYGAKSKLFRTATEAVDKAQQYAYRDRRNRKRDVLARSQGHRTGSFHARAPVALAAIARLAHTLSDARRAKQQLGGL